ncbi:MAG: SigB/SigF/SigG family RNA polymerase sigma factor [Actinomycetes bacterium]
MGGARRARGRRHERVPGRHLLDPAPAPTRWAGDLMVRPPRTTPLPPGRAPDAVHGAASTELPALTELPAPRDGRQHDALEAMAGLDPADPHRAALREEVVRAHLGLVEHLARRYEGRGEPLDDLVQVGTIGLLKAVDRFDPSRGTSLAAYAVPTILGEIRRHFRDRGWAVRVPRRLQELTLTLTDVRARLTQELGRAPTVAELAGRAGLDIDTVLEGLESAGAYSTVPLDPAPDDEPRLGADDDALLGVENREVLRPLLAALPARERRILALRFVRGLSQSQIAAEVGLSQMHVSRLLARSLATLREGMSRE